MSQAYQVLLYYKYVCITDPDAFMLSQRELCTSLNLKGRIIISDEGINGTVAGLTQDTTEYIRQTSAFSEFQDMEWKISSAQEQVFPRLSVKVRNEIVTLGVKKSGHDVHIENKAHYIKPDELLRLYEKKADFIILDARNQYEAKIGQFKDALIPPINNFREFPAFVKTIEKYKNKPVVTYCTGGIRCEKASAYLREQGFTQVKQLHGGIHEYGVKTGGKYFEGEMFVFDKRMHLRVNQTNPKVISECVYCHTKIARYIDCEIKSCNELFICCTKCQEKHLGLCQTHDSAIVAETACRSHLLPVSSYSAHSFCFFFFMF